MGKFLYPIYKLDLPSYQRWWLYNSAVKKNGVLSDILTGTSLTLENSLPKRFKIFDILGNTFQQSYTGKNKFPEQNVVADNSAYTLTLSADLPAGDYTFGAELAGTTSQTAIDYGCTVVIYNDTTRLLDFQLIPNDGRKVHEFTVNSSFNKITFRPGYSTGDIGQGYKITYSNIELDSGSTDGSYEPYCGRNTSPKSFL